MADVPKKKQPAKGAKKNTPAKKPEEKSKGNAAALNRQKTAVILFGIAVLSGCLVFIEGESGWALCHSFLFRVFGTCSYLLPFVLMYIAIVCAKDRPDTRMSNNVISASGLMLFVCATAHIFRSPAEYFLTSEIAAQVKEAWEKGTGGGVVGAVFGGAICKLLGKTGAGILTVVLLVVFILLVTGTTLPLLASYIKKPVKKVGEFTGEQFEKNAQKREEIRARKEQEEEEKKNKKPPELPDDNGTSHRGKTRVPAVLIEPDMPPVVAAPPVAVDALPKPISGTGSSLVPEMASGESAAPEKKPAKVSDKKPGKQKPEKPDEEKFTPPPEPEKRKKGKYVFPPIACLEKRASSGGAGNQDEMMSGANKLIATLESFKINATVTNISRGPSVTRYELVPEAGIRINKITSLADDIALRLAAESVRIEAPIPGKSAIGIEVPNSAKSMVSMREIIDTDQYRAGALKSKLNVALGKDITGNIITADLAKMPHLLVAGTTGSGKSVCLNTMIISILYNASPDDVKLLMIDPKMVEFTVYNGIAHLQVPVVSNPRKAAGALSWAVSEMEKRYASFAATGVRDIKGYNKLAQTDESLEKMHQIVIFIDELSDLMMASPKEVEDCICRLAQMARAAGIHLVIATQRPSVDVITGIIKANIPSRIALFVSSQTDSRTIIDQGGAEKLLGNGDMLFNPVGASKPIRVQGCFISDEEVEAVVNHIKTQASAEYDDEIMQEIEAKAAASGGKNGEQEDSGDDTDPMFNDAAEVAVNMGQVSTTMLQKKLKLGYARASRVMDQLEEYGIVGPSEGAKPRKVLITKQEWYERQALAAGGTGKDEQLEFDDLSVSGSPVNSQPEYEAPDEEVIYESEDTGEFIEDEPEDEPAEEEIFDEPEEFDEPEKLSESPADDISDEPEEVELSPEEVPWDEPAESELPDEEPPQETYYDKLDDEPVEYEVFDDGYEYAEKPADSEETDYENEAPIVYIDDILNDGDDDEGDDDDIDSYFN